MPLYSPWIFVLNKVEDLRAVKNFPLFRDDKWGRGKVLITTNNSLFSADTLLVKNIIHVGPLTSSEKLELFLSYSNKNKRSLSVIELIEIRNLLQQIPPYPYDVKVAAG